MDTDKPVMCGNCMIKRGYKREQGCHTAMVKHCDGCDTAKPIVPSRHWTKDVHADNPRLDKVIDFHIRSK